jgi:predicted exporter
MTAHNFKRACYTALTLLTLLAMLGGGVILRNGLHIDTNLKSLSPPLSQDAAVNKAVDKLSTDASKQLIIVVASKNADDVEAASDALREKISALHGPIQYLDQSAAMKAYLALLIQHRFYITGSAAQAVLAQPEDAPILSAATANLYGSGGAVRLIPLADDPLGFVNEYALGVLNTLSHNAQDELHQATLNGEQVFMSAHVLQLSSDALEMNAQDDALVAIKNLKQAVLHDYPQIEFLQSGIIFFAADSASTAKADINLIGMGSTIGVTLLFLWIFRSTKSLIIPVASMILGPLFALCICHLLFGSIHILTIVFGASLIGVVGDYSLHFYYFYNKTPDIDKSSLENNSAENTLPISNSTTSKTSENTLQLYRALFLSLMTSVIGYGALALSGLDALKQVAVFSGLGLIYSWLMVIVIGSALIKNNSTRIHDAFLQKTVAHLLTVFARLRYSTYLCLALLIVIALLAFNRLNFPANDSPKAFFALNPDLVAQEKLISGLVSTYEPSSFIVVDADNAQELYQHIESLQKILGDDADHLFGVHNFFPSPAQQALNYTANQRLYANNGIASQFLQQHPINSLSATKLSEDYLQAKLAPLSPAALFSQQGLTLPPFWIESGTRIYSFILIPKTLDTSTLKMRLSQLEHVRFVSAIADIETSLKHLRFSALQLLFVAVALISLMVVVQYTFWSMLKIMAVPTLSIVLSLAGLATLGIPITLFHIMALFLVLGLSMDYVIFAAEMTEDSVATLSAIVLAATTSLLSFGLLAFSSLPAVSAFGITVIIGSAFNLFGAIALASQKLEAK